MESEFQKYIEKSLEIDIDTFIVNCNRDTQECCDHTITILKHMEDELAHALKEIKVQTPNGFTVLDYIAIYHPLYKAVVEAYTAVTFLYKVCYCNLTDDNYDALVEAHEAVDRLLVEFVKLHTTEENLWLSSIQLTNQVTDPLLKLFDEIYKKESHNGILPVVGFLENVSFYGSKMPVYLQMMIYCYNSSIDAFRKYRMERSNEELAKIYTYWKNKYKKEKFANVWDSYKKRFLSHELRFQELSSSSVKRKREQHFQLFANSTLGGVWERYELDGDDVLANEISRQQVSRDEFYKYLENLCILEALNEWIEDLASEENDTDMIFKSWVDVENLKELLKFWIDVNITIKQEQWIVVYVAMRDTKIIINDLDPAAWAERMNRMFCSRKIKCSYESFRKLLPKKINVKKVHTMHIDNWDYDTPYFALTKELIEKLKQSKEKYTKKNFM